jgi:hypothetical protein
MAGGVDELDFGDVDALVDTRTALFGGKLDWSSYDVSFSSVRAVATLAFKSDVFRALAMTLSPTALQDGNPA